ncbi:DUF4062 domain-containing protein [Hellea balneolensis]|uniref:DUF4062 domain-containing protein n=1 Tax=Hellea balneolensis TaxID=287478 RepID=UPI000415ACCD|nr:DUF4062 domain-containing protein [Hellea balneolensis]
MDKRYQVFVSSTYADLKDERQKVIQTLMEMDCIPAGMELFPAADEEQWEFIKKVIDDCDYYLLVIGGRYGSTTDTGISYTEKEFDYAVGKGLKVIALVHGSPENISFGKSEKDPELRLKLEAFRDKVKTGRLVKFWDNIGELPGLVALSLTKTIKTSPATGWVRADKVANESLLQDLNSLRLENERLEQKLSKVPKEVTVRVDGIADLDSEFCFQVNYKTRDHYERERECRISWKEIFYIIAPYLEQHPSHSKVNRCLAEGALNKLGVSGWYTPKILEQHFQTVAVQLKAYGFVNTRYTKTTNGGMGYFWNLTEVGKKYMMEIRVVKK